MLLSQTGQMENKIYLKEERVKVVEGCLDFGDYFYELQNPESFN